MSNKTKYNPELRAWKGRSYKKGGKRIKDLLTIDSESIKIQSSNRESIMDINELAKKIGLTCESETAYPTIDGMAGYKVTLKRSGSESNLSAVMTVDFNMGADHRKGPEAIDVLDCLLTDASVLDYDDFEEWASEYGYDTDSRKAEAIYKKCLDQTVRLKIFLGGDFEDFINSERL